MNKKGVAIAVAVLALMIAGIVYALLSLYSDREEPARNESVPSGCAALLRAVPSDAALVFCFDGSRAAEKIAADSTGLLKAVFAPSGDAAFSRFLARACKDRTVVSLHNSGALVPLVVTEVSHADSASLAEYDPLAEAASLKTVFDSESGLLLASRSETLVNTALRHLSDGYSILQSDGFAEALQTVRGGAQVLVNGVYSTKLYQMYAAPARRRHADLARGLALWAALDIEEVTADKVVLQGGVSTTDRSYLRVFSGKDSASPAFPEVVPASVRSVEALVIPDLDLYLEAFTRYADARSGKRKLDDAWVRQMDVREVAAATFADGARLLFVRPGREPGRRKGACPDPHAAELVSLFGAPFRSGADTLCLQVGKWLVYGSKPALDNLENAEPLKSRLSGAGLSLPSGEGMVCYAALTGTFLSDLFSKPVADALMPYFGDVPFVPAVLSAGASGGKSALSLRLARSAVKADAALASALLDTAVVVPAGPFKVRNSATGKENTLYQNAHLSICLRDENGKDQWGVPFRERFCGRVETIDYYANGRLQYLFAAGSKLYLIDRLGRFVTGFPAELGREVLLGPDVYDFTGAHGYRAMVLHKDNTLSLYNLHGQRAENWKDIRPDVPVRGLPAYVDGGDGKHYWLVPTAAGTAVYGFGGGDPLPSREAAKILKRTKPNG